MDSPRSITVILDIAPDGHVSLRQASPPAPEAFLERAAPKRAARRPPPDYDVPFNDRYDDRNGYDPGYLGAGFEVNLPDLGALEDVAAELLPAFGGGHVLKYHNYSAVMHKQRRLALYTAANVDGGQRYKLSRTPDHWRTDPRIPPEAQIGEFYYKNNKFDRGHLTRREDLEFGPTVIGALVSAADTCHFTNCTPQHAEFNERRLQWQGLETHVLEDSVESGVFRAQVLTGPILDAGDPVFGELQYPVRFWKIAVAVNSKNRLFAAGFILDQTAVIARYGIEVAGAVPFAGFKTFQAPIEEIENQTGLRFTSGTEKAPLSLADPLRRGSPALAQAHVSETAEADAPPGYVLLDEETPIIR